MDGLLKWGIELILYLQGLGNWLAFPMQIFTFMGSGEFYLLLMPALYWCISAEIGLELGILLMFSYAVNFVFKMGFHQPRPSWLDPAVHPKTVETSFGIPSGHAQNAVTVWGFLDLKTRKLWRWVVAVLLTILIGFSRLVLGVHFPTDVLAGWLIGLLVLWSFARLRPAIRTWIRKLQPWPQVGLALAVSLLMIFAGALSRVSLGSWEIPQEWIDNAQKADPGSAPITPLDLSNIVSNGGVLFGLASGAVLISRRGGYQAKGKPLQLILRYLIGVAGVFALWRGLDLAFPSGAGPLPLMLQYVRYGLVGFWITGLAPLVFRRIGLSPTT